MWQVKIEIEPRGKQRPRLASKGRYARAYTPAPTVQWTKAFRVHLQQLWQGQPIPAGVAVGLKVVAVFSRPQRLLRRKDPDHRLYKTSTPDGDNVLKIIADACNGLCWHDDAQVAEMQVQTLYAAKGEPACIELSIYELKPCQIWHSCDTGA